MWCTGIMLVTIKVKRTLRWVVGGLRKHICDDLSFKSFLLYTWLKAFDLKKKNECLRLLITPLLTITKH